MAVHRRLALVLMAVLALTVSVHSVTSKCLLMKAEMYRLKKPRTVRPSHAFIDNDGIYDPECDNDGRFKAKQCNRTSTCWCVNSAGVRRTEKGDENITCSEVVRTSWIIIETTPVNTDLDNHSVKRAFTEALAQRYLLNQKHISVTYENPYITIELKQNASEKSEKDVDIADVAYYFEKEVKGNAIHYSFLNITVQGEPLQLKDTLIYYVDEKPPEFAMTNLTAGIIAVIVVVTLAVVAGILVLVFTRRKTGKYEKAEVKEMNEMHRELKS
ncbi:epithelial cell adhesion molecule isoform X2 [Sphaerodactylus townsendi]|uniref:epithelial cell adhesion molecule isoform X2 n=1 Tax=Sphaerodactylus townsendi TaxID=933632 RepID=UPI002025E625|nr:epithelial cell adhesion molecule isoform X2 [Sphaerodactylus townsendi]